jgi:3-oxoadipate enol-lactonase
VRAAASSAVVDVHHEVTGRPNAPAVILSNSLGTTTAMWDPQMHALAGRFRTVRYDHRGHGRSPVPSGPYDISDLGLDLIALMDRLDIERAHVCGVSLGGMVGMWLAATAAERLDRLVVCSTAAKLGPPEAWQERAATVRAEGTEAVADYVAGRSFTTAFAARHPEVVAEVRDMIASTPAEGYAACCEVIARMDLEPILDAIRAPTLVILGAQDPAVSPEHARRIAERVTDCRVEVIDGAHLVSIEQSQIVTRAIVEHLLQARPEEEP